MWYISVLFIQYKNSYKLAKLSEHDVFPLQHKDNSEGVEHLNKVDLKEIMFDTYGSEMWNILSKLR